MNTAPGNITQNMTRAGRICFNFLFPFALLGAFIFILFISLPYEIFLALLGLMGLYFVPPAGKESVIPIGISLGMPWWLIGTSIAMMDIVSTLFMILNFDLALKIPILGDRWMRSFMEHGEEFFAKHRWIEKFSSLGLAIFVMIPMQGTGGISTPIVGRMIGIPGKNVLIAVITGSLAGCYLIALGSEFIKDLFIADIKLGAGAVIIIALLFAGGVFLWNKNKRKLKERTP
ncbi:MAG: small multi-drug export protein [Methanomicrobium sp.]|nr:small multi-drug export protein [Methanomicrobium sp.]